MIACSARSARAQGEPIPEPSEEAPLRFGQKGQIVVSSGASIDMGRLSYSNTDQTAFNIDVDPRLDLFVAQNLSIGASLLLAFRQETIPVQLDARTIASKLESSSFRYGLAVRAGLNCPLGERSSFWPTLAIGVSNENVTSTSSSLDMNRDGFFVPTGDLRETAVWAYLTAPFLFHPTPHFFLGFGPRVLVDLFHEVALARGGVSLKNQRFSYGATSTLGGWF